MTRKELEDRLNKIMIAAKSLKIEAERAARIVFTNPVAAEKMLMAALKKAEEDGI